MINTAEIYLWGTRIAIIHLEPDSSTVTFEYDKNFLKSGIQVSPLKMPLSNRLYAFPNLDFQAFHGLPGLLADSLPDKFGNAVINQWLSSIGKTEKDFNALDRLCYHFLVDKNGKIYKGVFAPENNEICISNKYAAHTGGGNTGSIGVAMCAMAGFKNISNIQKPIQKCSSLE